VVLLRPRRDEWTHAHARWGSISRALLAFRSARIGLERVQANISPLEAQTHTHSDDKRLAQRVHTQVASDQRAHNESDLAEASELIMKRLVHYGKGLDGGEHIFDYRSVPGHRRVVLPLGLGELATWGTVIRGNPIIRSEVGRSNIRTLKTEWVIA